MDGTLYFRERLPVSPSEAFRLFATAEGVSSWLVAPYLDEGQRDAGPLATVEPRIGGAYELFWAPGSPEKESTQGCRVTAIARDELLAFEWKGPTEFASLMNVEPLTHVTVAFTPVHGGTEVHLVHSGWGPGERWAEARRWFERAWTSALEQLGKRAASR